MKVVLDTNCLLQIVFPKSQYKDVWTALVGQKYELCLTNEIVMEYREIIERRFGDVQFAEAVVEAIIAMPNAEFVNPSYRFNLIKADPDDNKFVDCAITAGATYVVSNDHHFDELKEYEFPKVDVRTLIEFREIINNLR
ncbi:MAG: putative toxin-antitoxin system toxin component, PIN family [Prevotella sp.]|nr:putative toxin-antitoxin system toxin component, PIN family [Prevotella sp.]